MEQNKFRLLRIRAIGSDDESIGVGPPLEGQQGLSVAW